MRIKWKALTGWLSCDCVLPLALQCLLERNHNPRGVDSNPAAAITLTIGNRMVKDDLKYPQISNALNDAHSLHTHSLKSTARSGKPKGIDMRGIQKIKNKDGSHSYRAQVRLKDGLSQQSKNFPTLVEARAWKAQEEVKRRQGMYFPTMTSKHNRQPVRQRSILT